MWSRLQALDFIQARMVRADEKGFLFTGHQIPQTSTATTQTAEATSAAADT
jgi:hypothetical protein